MLMTLLRCYVQEQLIRAGESHDIDVQALTYYNLGDEFVDQ